VLGVRDEAGAYTLYRELGDEYDERSARMASIEDAEGLEGIKDAQNAIATELTRRRERVAAAKALRPAELPTERIPRTPTKVSWTVYRWAVRGCGDDEFASSHVLVAAPHLAEGHDLSGRDPRHGDQAPGTRGILPAPALSMAVSGGNGSAPCGTVVVKTRCGRTSTDAA
jgi:hypothetical protein